MAKGAQVRELLQALQLKEQELRGPGVEGTGKELMPVDEAGVDTMFERLEEMRDQYDMDSPEWNELNEKIGDLTETFGTYDDPTPFTQAMESLELPDVSRRSFLKGLAATMTPNPLSIIGDLGEVAADIPIAPMAKMAVDTISELPTTRIELLKPVWDIVEDLYDTKKLEIRDELRVSGQVNEGIVNEDLVDWYAGKEGLEEEAFELANEWHNYPFGGEGHHEMLDKVKDEVEALLWDSGLDRDVARELAETVEDATWPEFQQFDAANPYHAGAAFETDINAPQEVLDLIEKAIDGQDLGDWQAMKQAGRTVISRPSGLRVESDIVTKPPKKFAKGGTVKAIVRASEDRELEQLRQYARGTVQPGVFSTLDEVIKAAPFEVNSGSQWEAYLQPGRMLKREGMQFPLRQEELDWSIKKTLSSPTYGDTLLTKTELRDLVGKSRLEFSLSTATEEFDYHGDIVNMAPPDSMPPRWIELEEKYGMEAIEDISNSRERSNTMSAVEPRAARWGQLYSDEARLYHASPGSRYEESVTETPAIHNKQGHMGPNAISWSRTSSHDYVDPTIEGPLQTVRVRLVDEIQSDVHRQAAQAHYENAKTGEGITPYQYKERVEKSGLLHGEFNEADWQKKRLGYITDADEPRLDELEQRGMEIEAELDAIRNPEDSLDQVVGRDYDEHPRVQELQDQRQAVIDEEMSITSRPDDIPFKNPKDYAGVELRKQLVNAVEEGEDFLALVRGRDQIERYAGMGEAEQASSQHFYDNVYLAELKKLGKRYGANLEEVELTVGMTDDLRLANMAEFDAESFQDFMDISTSFMGEASDKSSINMAMGNLWEDVGQLNNRMGYDDYDATAHMEGARETLGNLADEIETIQKTLNDVYEDALADSSGPGRPDDPTGATGLQIWEKQMDRLTEMGVELDKIYGEYTKSVVGDATTTKTFPALRLTDEVKTRVRNAGVPQYALGGLVQKFAKGGDVRTLLKALQLKEQELRGPGVEGTGKEMVPVDSEAELQALAEQYGVELDDLAEGLPGGFKIPNVSRRSFLKGIAGAALPNPGLDVLKGAVGEAAAAAPAAKTIGKLGEFTDALPSSITLWRPISDQYDDALKDIIGEKYPDIMPEDIMSQLDDVDYTEAMDRAKEATTEWNDMYAFGSTDESNLLEVQDVVADHLADAGVDYGRATEMAKEVTAVSWPEHRGWGDTYDAQDAYTEFEFEIEAPDELTDKISTAMAGGRLTKEGNYIRRAEDGLIDPVEYGLSENDLKRIAAGEELRPPLPEEKALGGLIRKYQEGGLVREQEVQQRPGGLSVFSMLSSGDLSEDEIQEVMDDLKEAGYDRETQELMGTWDYWKDTLKRVPAVMSSMWKTLDEDTGLAEWKFPIPQQKPYIGMGEEDVRSMMEYNEMAREHNVGVRPGIIDDTIGVAALPYAGYNWAFRGEEGDEPVEIPESIMEAMGRSQELMETIEQDWELGEARGLPQHTATGLGVMLGQVPSPKSAAEALFGSAARVAKPLTSRLPGAVRTAGSVAMFPVKAGAEFFDPTVNPSFKNYLIGSGFGAALGTTAEAVSDDTPRSYEEVKADRELKVLQEKQYFDTISNYTEENWDELPLQTQLSMLSNDDPEVNEAVWEALNQEQQQELLRAADAAGMFEELDDAE